MMYYKRIREIDVPEMMASILVEMPHKPWAFHRDMTRQLWDEARHAMLGDVGFRSVGIDWTQIPISFLWSYNLNTQLTATERHAVLFYIEQGLMPRTGKRFEWEVGLASETHSRHCSRTSTGPMRSCMPRSVASGTSRSSAISTRLWHTATSAGPR